MRTLTITLHDTDNAGSSLQAFALNHFLLNNEIDNKLINYTPKYTYTNGNSLKSFIKTLIFWRYKRENRKKFVYFRERYIKMTNIRYKTLDKLMSEIPTADVYITGSDQLWNNMYPCGNDPAFYLSFVKNSNSKKIAYAISTGRSEIPVDNLEFINKYCKDYNWISVREKDIIEQFEKVLNREDIIHVSDPVLLNSADTYINMIEERIVSEAYILVYIAQNVDKKILNSLIDKIKEELPDRKVVFIGAYGNKCNCDLHIKEFGPLDFLSLIYYSDYIISNSFHATVFSILFKKQFITFIPENNGSRIKGILKITHLENRGIYNIGEISKIFVSDSEIEEASCLAIKFGTESGKVLINAIRGLE